MFRAIVCAAAVAACAPIQSVKAAEGEVIALYQPGALKPLPVPERTDTLPNGQRVVRNVSSPTLEVFRPAADRANGTAVIVAPGGGFMMLSYDSEGAAVARRLAEAGATAFLLKYRVAQTPENPLAFAVELRKQLSGGALKTPPDRPGEVPRFATEGLAAEDAAQAVRLVRRRAADWGVDPKRIGFVGFSAGAITGANVAIGEASARPDFVGLIYGAVRGPVPADAPPAFIAASADDPLLPGAATPIYAAWKAAGPPAELHVYERGGHGYGLNPQGASSDHWIDAFLWWLDGRGLLKAAKR